MSLFASTFLSSGGSPAASKQDAATAGSAPLAAEVTSGVEESPSTKEENGGLLTQASSAIRRLSLSSSRITATVSAAASRVGASLRETTSKATTSSSSSSSSSSTEKSGDAGEGDLLNTRASQLSVLHELLDSVRLQCPQTQAGLVVVYSLSTLSPLNNPGVRFTWYRTKSEGEVTFRKIEESMRSWYPPTADDIGHRICLQCEDTFGEGYSRYIESNVLLPDAVLSALTESAIESSLFECPDVSVSLGTEELGDANALHYGFDASTSPVKTLETMEFDSAIASRSSSLAKPEAGKSTPAFFQMRDRSFVSVSSEGVFVSISSPPHPPASSSSSSPSSSSSTSSSSKMRGLFIPASVDLSVHCTMPVSVVLVVNLKKKAFRKAEEQKKGEEGEVEAGADEAIQPPPKKEQGEGKDEVDGEAERSDVASSTSILAMPWQYITRKTLGGDVGGEDVEVKVAREGERDGGGEGGGDDGGGDEGHDEGIFSDTVCSIAELVSSLPAGTKKLRLCFVCSDRMQRDALALTLRALACVEKSTSTEDRLKTLPWIDASGQRVLTSATSETAVEMGERLNVLENENVKLKRERVELTMQLLERHEGFGGAQVMFEYPASPISAHASSSTSSSLSSSSSSSSASATSESQEDKASTSASSTGEDADGDKSSSPSPPTSTSPTASTSSSVGPVPLIPAGTIEARGGVANIRALSSNVSELYAQLLVQKQTQDKALAENREYESANRAITNENKLLTKSNKLLSEQMATYKAEASTLTESLNEKSALLVTEKDLTQKLQAKEEALRRELEAQQQALSSLRAERDALNASLEASKSQLQESLSKLTSSKQESEAKISSDAAHIAQLEQQLLTTLASKASMSAEVATMQTENKRLEQQLEGSTAMQAERDEARERADKLFSELNHEKKKGESTNRELKKVLKENAATFAEFEKALMRKSEENNQLYEKLNKLQQESESAAATGGAGGGGAAAAAAEAGGAAISSMSRFASSLASKAKSALSSSEQRSASPSANDGADDK